MANLNTLEELRAYYPEYYSDDQVVNEYAREMSKDPEVVSHWFLGRGQPEKTDPETLTGFGRGIRAGVDNMQGALQAAGAYASKIAGARRLSDELMNDAKLNFDEAGRMTPSNISYKHLMESGNATPGDWASAIGFYTGNVVPQVAAAAGTGGAGAVGSRLLLGSARSAAGFHAGVAAHSVAQQTGFTYDSALERSRETGEPVDMARVGVAGLAGGAMEYAGTMMLLGAGRLVPKGTAAKLEGLTGARSASRGVRTARGAGAASLGEGVTETGQTGFEWWGSGRPLDFDNPELEDAMQEAFFAGVLSGPVIGGLGGALSPNPQEEAASREQLGLPAPQLGLPAPGGAYDPMTGGGTQVEASPEDVADSKFRERFNRLATMWAGKDRAIPDADMDAFLTGLLSEDDAESTRDLLSGDVETEDTGWTWGGLPDDQGVMGAAYRKWRDAPTGVFMDTTSRFWEGDREDARKSDRKVQHELTVGDLFAIVAGGHTPILSFRAISDRGINISSRIDMKSNKFQRLLRRYTLEGRRMAREAATYVARSGTQSPPEANPWTQYGTPNPPKGLPAKPPAEPPGRWTLPRAPEDQVIALPEEQRPRESVDMLDPPSREVVKIARGDLVERQEEDARSLEVDTGQRAETNVMERPRTWRPQEVPLEGVSAPPIQYVQTEALSLSDDVPQFKRGADEKGVIEPLTGRYTQKGSGPLLVWERTDGRLEVVSGRHRYDLARRNMEDKGMNNPDAERLPVQIVREVDGFTQEMAQQWDAFTNIRDNQGSVSDFITLFRNSPIDEQLAHDEGLLGSLKGRQAWTIARKGSPVLIGNVMSGDVGEVNAVKIAETAPNDEALQTVGVQQIQDGNSGEHAINMMMAVRATSRGRTETGDMFGFDDTMVRNAERLARAARSKQKSISRILAAITGAGLNPQIAVREGIDINDPIALQDRITELRFERDQWARWDTSPELRAQLIDETDIQQEIGYEDEAAPQTEDEFEQNLAEDLFEAQMQEREAVQIDVEATEMRSKQSSLEGEVAQAAPNVEGDIDMVTAQDPVHPPPQDTDGVVFTESGQRIVRADLPKRLRRKSSAELMGLFPDGYEMEMDADYELTGGVDARPEGPPPNATQDEMRAWRASENYTSPLSGQTEDDARGRMGGAADLNEQMEDADPNDIVDDAIDGEVEAAASADAQRDMANDMSSDVAEEADETFRMTRNSTSGDRITKRSPRMGRTSPKKSFNAAEVRAKLANILKRTGLSAQG